LILRISGQFSSLGDSQTAGQSFSAARRSVAERPAAGQKMAQAASFMSAAG
jgi:hypothetical protein